MFWVSRLAYIALVLSVSGTIASQLVVRDEQSVLAQSALDEILRRGAPILGFDEGCSSSSATCAWMAKVPDKTKLVELSIPGTHDAATWNYTQARQDELIRYTGPVREARLLQCQEHSLFQMLNGGVRALDLRVAWNPGNDTIGFYHSDALLAPTTSLEDVFFGFYSWLDAHPSETILVSVNIEPGPGRTNDAKVQQHLFDIFTSDLAKRYWVQTMGELGTLDEARGKLVLLQRFAYTLFTPPIPTPNPHGIFLDPARWTNNGPDITLIYNASTNATAFIEDYYEIGLPTGSNSSENIQWKFNATVAHLERAINEEKDQLWISFASSEHVSNVPPQTPRIMALGKEGVNGVNQKLLPWLQERKGGRFGVIMLDFFDSVPGVVEAIIGV